MHPTISYLLAQAHTADLRQQAHRDAIARAARRARARARDRDRAGQTGAAAPGFPALGRSAARAPLRRPGATPIP